MLTSNQLTDIFQQQYGRNPSPQEISEFQDSDLNSFSNTPDPTYANVNGTIYNKTTNTPYSSPAEFAAAVGADPNNINWSSYNFDTAYKPGQPENQTPYSTPQTQPGPGYNVPQPTPAGTVLPASEQTQAPGTPSTPTDGTSGYNPVSDYEQYLNSSGATAAYQNVQNLQSQYDQLTNTINGYKQDKIKQVQEAGGVVDEDQLDAEVANEQQPLILQQQALGQQLSEAQSAYQTSVSNAQQLSTLGQQDFTDQQTLQKNALDESNDLLTAIGNGSVDPSQIDPQTLSQLEYQAGLPAGTLSNAMAKNITPHYTTDANGNVYEITQKSGQQPTVTNLGQVGKPTKGASTPASETPPPTAVSDTLDALSSSYGDSSTWTLSQWTAVRTKFLNENGDTTKNTTAFDNEFPKPSAAQSTANTPSKLKTIGSDIGNFLKNLF